MCGVVYIYINDIQKLKSNLIDIHTLAPTIVRTKYGPRNEEF